MSDFSVLNGVNVKDSVARLGLNGKLSLNGGTITGATTIQDTLTLYNEGTIQEDNPTTIRLQNKTTDENYGFTSSAYIYAHEQHSAGGGYGINLVVQPGGGLFIGSGESPQNHYNEKLATAPYTSESTFITADSYIYLQANGNTITDRKGLAVSTTGNILPCAQDTLTNNILSVGTSGYRWASMYATSMNTNEMTINTSLDGNFAIANQARYPYLRFKPTNSTNDGDGYGPASIFLNSGSDTAITYNRMYFRICSPTSSAATNTTYTQYYEQFVFPPVDIGRTAHATYEIMTEKGWGWKRANTSFTSGYASGWTATGVTTSSIILVSRNTNISSGSQYSASVAACQTNGSLNLALSNATSATVAVSVMWSK